MSRSNSAALPEHSTRSALSAFLFRQIFALTGFALFLLLVLAVAALATWNVSDPSLSYATDNPPTNILGLPGAVFADLMMQFFGLGSLLALLPVLAWSFALIGGRKLNRIPARIGAWFAGALIAAAAVGCFPPPNTWPLPSGTGGVLGDLILRFPALFIGAYPTSTFAMVLGGILALPATWLMLFAAGILGKASEQVEDDEPVAPIVRRQPKEPVFDDGEDDEDSEGPIALMMGAVTHNWYTARARVRRLFGLKASERRDRDFDQPYDFNDDEFGTLNEPVRAKAPPLNARVEPSLEGAPARPVGRSIVSPPPMSTGSFDDEDDDFDLDDMPRPAGILPDSGARGASARTSGASARVVAPAARPKPGARVDRDAQGSLLRPEGFQLPSVHLLAEPRAVARDATLSAEALEHNARLLEGVLDDFGVKGEIIHVRPGPVVTLYELEPAPGIKSSRVIGLADDIARSMSAIAARVAVVPGRNAIGIELPNPVRETVYLRELIETPDYAETRYKLPVCLGKTIGGEPVIAELAKMPHLLVAGTTGSGKSVAINTMILSLLYRFRPDECRLIMVDPKMLELSVYDGIPHLLTPVVTDPKKAVMALKWAVREMEDRYRKMSRLGVRNIDGYNARAAQAREKGETITVSVQTGFDRQSGEIVYEEQELDLSPMPYIVVVVDEMADLMMVAGKEIEGAIQRLAQMARAAGIHLIMATQRPSVDVITGTIKANFPTRVSFQVTSKIDSRTILGEPGAEHLLGQGDMLHMVGGGRIARVHGPFVSDEEVEKVVAHLKMQGRPEYLGTVTEDADEVEDEPEEDVAVFDKSAMGEEDGNDLYDKAVKVVLRDKKCSTSYIQRRLSIGYNKAASLVERMEQEGIVGAANHVGKRAIIVGGREVNAEGDFEG